MGGGTDDDGDTAVSPLLRTGGAFPAAGGQVPAGREGRRPLRQVLGSRWAAGGGGVSLRGEAGVGEGWGCRRGFVLSRPGRVKRLAGAGGVGGAVAGGKVFFAGLRGDGGPAEQGRCGWLSPAGTASFLSCWRASSQCGLHPRERGGPLPQTGARADGGVRTGTRDPSPNWPWPWVLDRRCCLIVQGEAAGVERGGCDTWILSLSLYYFSTGTGIRNSYLALKVILPCGSATVGDEP